MTEQNEPELRSNKAIESFREMWLSQAEDENIVLYRFLGFDEEGFPILIPAWEERDYSWWDE